MSTFQVLSGPVWLAAVTVNNTDPRFHIKPRFTGQSSCSSHHSHCSCSSASFYPDSHLRPSDQYLQLPESIFLVIHPPRNCRFLMSSPVYILHVYIPGLLLESTTYTVSVGASQTSRSISSRVSVLRSSLLFSATVSFLSLCSFINFFSILKHV